MSINAAIASPLALREGFHVVLLKALAERLQGRDWVLKGGTNLRLYFSSIRFSEDIDLNVGKDIAGSLAAQVAIMSSMEICVNTDVEADGPIPGPNSMLK